MLRPRPWSRPTSRTCCSSGSDPRARYHLARALLEGGFRLSLAASYGVVELLLRQTANFDLLVTVQSLGEMAQFGLPQLARSAQPDLPILVLELETAGGPGVVAAVSAAIDRWPLRDRSDRRFH